VSRFRKAVAVTAVAVAVILALLIRAYLVAKPPFTENDLRVLAYREVLGLVEEAIAHGGLPDAERRAEERISLGVGTLVDIWRPYRPRLDPPLGFLVRGGGLEVWVSPEGMPDPLIAMRTGERHPIDLDPGIEAAHGVHEILSRCLSDHLVHARVGAPDLFARIENRTTGDGHGGFEAFVATDGGLALDRFALAGIPTPPEALRRYRL
jgi:hypothetical protein